jgi:lysophospholipase L1-like esterase
VEFYEPDIQALEGKLRRRPPPQSPVVFYGSSSIRLWTTLASDFEGADVVNLGFGGSTLAACSWFYWRIVRPLAPRALVLYAGDNDLGDGRAPRDVVEQLRFLLQQVDASAPEATVSVISIKPSPARWGIVTEIVEANRGMQALVEKRNRGIWVNVFDRMVSGATPRTELFAEDGLHLSPAGYALWTRELNALRPAAF